VTIIEVSAHPIAHVSEGGSKWGFTTSDGEVHKDSWADTLSRLLKSVRIQLRAILRGRGGGVSGVWKPQNRTEKH